MSVGGGAPGAWVSADCRTPDEEAAILCAWQRKGYRLHSATYMGCGATRLRARRGSDAPPGDWFKKRDAWDGRFESQRGLENWLSRPENARRVRQRPGGYVHVGDLDKALLEASKAASLGAVEKRARQEAKR